MFRQLVEIPALSTVEIPALSTVEMSGSYTFKQFCSAERLEFVNIVLAKWSSFEYCCSKLQARMRTLYAGEVQRYL
jgi:hypothetical protein